MSLLSRLALVRCLSSGPRSPPGPSAPVQPPLPISPLDPGTLQLDSSTISLFTSRLHSHIHRHPSTPWRYKGPDNTTWRHAGICIPLVTIDDDPSVLLTLRSAKLRRHGGEVSFPGGSQDPGDRDIVDTALRETEEEVGIPRVDVTVLGVLHPLPDRSHTILIHPVLCHVPTVSSVASLSPNATEVSEVFSVPLAHLLCGRDVRTEEFRGSSRVVPNWTVGGKRIWGLTAWVLQNLLQDIVAPGGTVACDAWMARTRTTSSGALTSSTPSSTSTTS
ncbi:nudix (nucleoside diphosphate linked moiety X)-type motif 8 [Thoreauomyces humboldtii]|nr:nudix (nucleoside diphosphate linked moiety X)-type motif 8 [Thoreauomyces humboldtii]